VAERRAERESRMRMLVAGEGKGDAAGEGVSRARRWARVGVVRWVSFDRSSETGGGAGGD